MPERFYFRKEGGTKLSSRDQSAHFLYAAQFNFSALALIPFSLAAASNPATICSVIIFWGGGTAGGGGGEGWESLDPPSTNRSILRVKIKNTTDLR